MSKSNLAAFRAADAQPERPKPRLKGRGPTVGVTLRLTPQQWRRVHELSLTVGLSINALAIDGLSRLLADHGLQPL